MCRIFPTSSHTYWWHMYPQSKYPTSTGRLPWLPYMPRASCLCQPCLASCRHRSICLRFSLYGREWVNSRVLIYLCIGIFLPREEAAVKGKGREEGTGEKAQKKIVVDQRSAENCFPKTLPLAESPGMKGLCITQDGNCNLNYVWKHLAVLILKLPAGKKMWFSLQCHWGTCPGVGIIKMKTLMSKPWYSVSKTYVLPPPLASYFILIQD